MTLRELCAHKSFLCTRCGAKGKMKVMRKKKMSVIPVTEHSGYVKCQECEKEWFAVVPQYQR